MRQRQEYATRPSGVSDVPSVALYEDYAIVDKSEKTFVLGNVQRMVLKGQYGAKDYRLPVPYTSPQKDSLSVHVQFYEKVGSSSTGHLYSLTEVVRVVKFSDILSHVNMKVSDCGQFDVPASEVDLLDAEVSKMFPPKTVACTKASSTSSATVASERVRNNQYSVDDGMLRTVVVPPDNETGLRRSSRQRTVIHSGTNI